MCLIGTIYIEVTATECFKTNPLFFLKTLLFADLLKHRINDCRLADMPRQKNSLKAFSVEKYKKQYFQ